VIPELEEVIKELTQQNYNELVVEDPKLARAIKNVPTTAESPSNAGRVLRSKLLSFMHEFEEWKSDEEISQFIQKINIQLTRQKIKEISEQKDQFIAQAIEAVDDSDRALNVFASRIREWYGLHFPELDKNLASHPAYVRIVGRIGNRDQISSKKLGEVIGFPSQRAAEIEKMAGKSMGASITEFELDPLRKFAIMTEQLFENRDQLANYIDEAMQEVAPNMRALVGALLGARLISLAGGLTRLARMPASTVQVLGAEKALFRSLRTGARPPKHGIIFQWEEIHGAQYWLKGKIARALAGKLSIASRIDLYSGEYMGDNLLQDVKQRIEDIKKKYPIAPKKAQKEPGKEWKEGAERRRPHRERPHGEKPTGGRPHGEKPTGERPGKEKSKKFKKKWKKEKRNRPNKEGKI
jgi:nucleolar protein 56